MSHRSTLAIMLLAAAAAPILSGCSHPAPDTQSGPTGPSSSKSITVKDANGKTTAELFRGRFPGVDVTEVPGRGIKVRIRNPGGQESFRNGESGEPLYVVDGLPIEAVDGTLFIDPTTITKIEIVDTASLSLYGIRGANGVVKITTKRK